MPSLVKSEEKSVVPLQPVAVNAMVHASEENIIMGISTGESKTNLQRCVPSMEELMCNQQSLWKDNNALMKDFIASNKLD